MKTPSPGRAVAALVALTLTAACGGPATEAGAPADPTATATPTASPNPTGTPAPTPDPAPTPTPGPAPVPTPPPTPTGPAPVVAALGVHGAPPAGGTIVTIAGSGFVAGTAVSFGGVASPSVQFDAVNHVLAAVTPPHAEGLVDVVVSNPDGQLDTVPGFHFGPPPAPASFSPGTIAKAGDLVVVDGSAFAGVQVLFGPAIAAVVAQSATALTVSAPKLNPGSYQVIVTNPDGQFGVAPGLVVYPGP